MTKRVRDSAVQALYDLDDKEAYLLLAMLKRKSREHLNRVSTSTRQTTLTNFRHDFAQDAARRLQYMFPLLSSLSLSCEMGLDGEEGTIWIKVILTGGPSHRYTVFVAFHVESFRLDFAVKKFICHGAVYINDTRFGVLGEGITHEEGRRFWLGFFYALCEEYWTQIRRLKFQ